MKACARNSPPQSRARNRALVVAAERAAKPGLVFVREKKHGKILVEQIRKAGLNAEFVWGEKNTSQRDEAIRKLEDGELDVIVCSVVFQTGTDIPSLRSLVIGTGGKVIREIVEKTGAKVNIEDDGTVKVASANGESIRAAIKWIKSIKSITRFTFTDERPVSFWEELAGNEYGFWANVNPGIPHPRWPQKSERLLGTDERVPTMMFNGYRDQVEYLYSAMQVSSPRELYY